MTQQQVEEYLLQLPDVQTEQMSGEDITIYKVYDQMFALVYDNSEPLQISLKCDPRLAVLLRQRYESVMPGRRLNTKHWNTVLVTGQLDDQEIIGLIRHSYELVSASKQQA